MRFLKLDTRQISGFDAVLGDEVLTFPAGTFAAIKSLAGSVGWANTIRRVARAFGAPDADAYHLVKGNSDRKRIRLPWLFGNPFVMCPYRRIKVGQASLLRDALELVIEAQDPETVIIYNGSVAPDAVLAHVTKGRRRVFVEAGFFPKTLQIDAIGLNGANSVPRTSRFYLDAEEDFAARGLPEKVNDRASKIADNNRVALPADYVFVPFQVPSDMQVTVHSPWVRDMEQFLDVVIEAANRNTNDVFVIKEHPSFKRSVKGRRPQHQRVIFANQNVTSDLIRNARAVLTLNSTVGIESLLFDRPVITLGRACYNVDGLVQQARNAPELDDALAITKTWKPNPRLRRQFLGYLWNSYLTQGTYDNLPKDLGDRLTQISQM